MKIPFTDATWRRLPQRSEVPRPKGRGLPGKMFHCIVRLDPGPKAGACGADSGQRGAALVVALLMLLILTLIGISSINLTVFETQISGNERTGNAAFYAADGGASVGVSRVPDIAAYSGELANEQRYRSGRLRSSAPEPLKQLGTTVRPGYDTTWEFKRFQVNATGESSGAAKEVEVQISMGPYSGGTQYNN
jgi:Tfp pilus assembly protein PilX